MFGVPGVGDGFKEGLEARRAAAVFGWGAAFALDIARIFGSGFAIPDRFDGYDMFPVIAHVVGIEELDASKNLWCIAA